MKKTRQLRMNHYHQLKFLINYCLNMKITKETGRSKSIILKECHKHINEIFKPIKHQEEGNVLLIIWNTSELSRNSLLSFAQIISREINCQRPQLSLKISSGHIAD